jgi:hypothetical protein
LGIELHPIPNHISANAHSLDINKLHTMFGHPNSKVLAASVSKYGFKTKNTLEHTCPNCAICKAKQKNLNKFISNPSTELGGRINIDISSVQTLSYGSANFWLLIQDDLTGYLWSYFIKAKSELPASMFDWLLLVKKEISISQEKTNVSIKWFKNQTTTSNLNSLHLAHHNKMEKLNVHLQYSIVKPGICSTQVDLLRLSDMDFGQAAQA